MADAGIFTPGDRIELIDEKLIGMAPIGRDQAAAFNVLNRTLSMVCGDRAFVSGQNPARIDDYSEPLPDFVVLQPRRDNYRTPPRAGSRAALLIIDVADSSRRVDRTVKLPLYARAGYPEVWIVDVKNKVVTASTDPSDGDCATIHTHRTGDSIRLSQASAIVIPLIDVFE